MKDGGLQSICCIGASWAMFTGPAAFAPCATIAPTATPTAAPTSAPTPSPAMPPGQCAFR
jgi:hypothetical protein